MVRLKPAGRGVRAGWGLMAVGGTSEKQGEKWHCSLGPGTPSAQADVADDWTGRIHGMLASCHRNPCSCLFPVLGENSYQHDHDKVLALAGLS